MIIDRFRFVVVGLSDFCQGFINGFFKVLQLFLELFFQAFMRVENLILDLVNDLFLEVVQLLLELGVHIVNLI